MRSDGTLDSGFSSDNVEVNAAASQDGNVKFTVAPKTARGDARPPRFFIPILAGLSLCTTAICRPESTRLRCIPAADAARITRWSSAATKFLRNP